MVGMIINLLITLIGVSVVAALGMYYWPKIQDMLEAQLSKSLNRDTDEKYNRPLYKVFYKFNHASSIAWANWIVTQDDETKNKGFAKLIEHLEEDPKEWGAVTPEVVTAVVAYDFPESFDVLVDFIESCREVWGKFKTVKFCYEEACKGLVTLNVDNAKGILLNEMEISKKRSNAEDMKRAIIDALALFPEDAGVEDIFIRVISNKEHDASVRDYAVNAAQRRESDDEVQTIFRKSVEQYIKPEFGTLDNDDNRVLERLLGVVCEAVVEEQDAWDILMQACENPGSSKCAMEVLASKLPDANMQFAADQLYQAMTVQNNHNLIVKEGLTKRHLLSSEEIQIIEEAAELAKNPFIKDIIASEKLEEAMFLPSGINDRYKEIEDVLQKKKMPDEKGEKRTGGGVLISGKAEAEKLFLARAIASKKKWTFIYSDVVELIEEMDDINKLLKDVRSSKPCILYLDNITSLLKGDGEGKAELVKALRQLVADPMFFIVGTIPDTVNLDQLTELPPMLSELPRDLFPMVRNLDECTDKQKRKLYDLFLSKLVPGRGQEQASVDDMISFTIGLSMIEYLSYLRNYFQTVLLVFGKLVSLDEYNNLRT